MKEYPAEWIAALRSGKYKQARGALRYDGGFCCLGVLCELKDPSRWHGNNWGEEFGGVLPKEIASELGISEFGRKGVLFISAIDEYATMLTDLNDYVLNFNQIADIIEYFWREL